jgi:hypothetical protein
MVKTCKNTNKKTYTGKENTPLGRGYHAEGEKINKKMKGKDGHMYKVIKIKNGKRWLKINKLKSPTKKTKRGDMDPEAIKILQNNLDSSKDTCEYINKSIGSRDYTLRKEHLEEMRTLVDKKFKLCDPENKSQLVERLSSQFDNTKAADFAIDKLINAVKPKQNY